MGKILGLDLGTNSIGWAIVEIEDGIYKLLAKGVRIFQEGVKIEKGIESSKAAERTGYRSARRIKYRRKLRKIEVLKVLSEQGYCPPLSEEELKLWRYKKIYPQNNAFKEWYLTDNEGDITERKALTKNPYYYRYLAATEKFDFTTEQDRHRFGRAIYHLAQRRGFLSNRLDSTPENENSKVTSAISYLNKLIKAADCKTLGQYFYQKYLQGEKIRSQYTHREEHYLSEFNFICEAQNIPVEVKTLLYKAIFYQRPLKSQKGLIGKCVFETNKQRCATSRPEFEEFRMLSFINNIKIKTPDDEKLRFLNEDEKQKIIPQFFRVSKDHFDFIDLAKKLANEKQCKFYKSKDVNPEDTLFNYSMNTTVSGCPVTARFKSLFGDDYLNLAISYTREKDNKESTITMDDVWHVLNTFDSNEKLAEFAQKRLGFDDDQIKSFVNTKLKNDYASLSLKAINKINRYLKAGLIYSHAVFLANMENAIPKEIWNEEENQRIIQEEILRIIETQNEEKLIIDVVNGIIKTAKNEKSTWSNEAAQLYKEDILRQLKAIIGPKRFASYTPEKQNQLHKDAFALLEEYMPKNNGIGEFIKVQTIDERIKGFISDNFNIEAASLEKLYHPSALDIYKAPYKGKDGKYYLGSPMVTSVRNPMAMRAMHQLRKVTNELIKNELIDKDTKIHIEMARDLMNANERAGLKNYQKARENQRESYRKAITEHFEEQNIKADPSEDDILKYQLWEEQKRVCLYTGDPIALSDFIGADPKYDIEHTIPRSLSFNDSQENKTLCEGVFNRKIKRNKIPSELANHSEILERITHWKEEYEKVDKLISIQAKKAKTAFDKNQKDKAIQERHKLTLERNYLRNKYTSFARLDVPSGFKNSQLVDTGIITKYARLYLQSLFNKVYTVKGNTVADFRKCWGLQDNYSKKARVNHVHHCIDAITIACMSKQNYELLAKHYHDMEDSFVKNNEKKPFFPKPWKTFTEDIKNIENEILVSHHTPDNLPKQSKRILRKGGKKQYDQTGKEIFLKGDTVRGSLHKDTFYGAIIQKNKNSNGKTETVTKYVKREWLDPLNDTQLKNIVDDRIREIVSNGRKEQKLLEKSIAKLKAQLTKAEEHEEPAIKASIEGLKNDITNIYCLPNKNGAPIPIKKVRVYQPSVSSPIILNKKQRDVNSRNPKPHKENYYVVNDGNYLMAIYDGTDAKGMVKRDYKLINNLEGGDFFKKSTKDTLLPQNKHTINDLINSGLDDDVTIKYVLKQGQSALLYTESPDELWEMNNHELGQRLYVIRGLDKDGIKLYYHQEARPTTDVIKFMNEVIDTGYRNECKIDTKKTSSLLKSLGIKISDKEINTIAKESNGKYLVLNNDGETLATLDEIDSLLKTSKLSTPKGGDVIGRKDEFPYIKFKAGNFKALVEGVDFELDTLGQITRLN